MINLTIFRKILLGAVLIQAPFVAADTARGLEIAEQRKVKNQGWGDTTSEMTMILRSANGKESVRKMQINSLEVDGDGDKGLTIFYQPADVRGSAFLSHAHTVGPDDQWLYLPALKRVKRIASRNKSGPFMGSEFAYEDMVSFEVEKYTFNYLRDEPCSNNLTCFVVEQTPVDKNSGYTRQVTWVDNNEYRLHKVEYYDRKGALLKTLKMTDYQLYLDKHWRAMNLEMVNHQRGKSTELKIDSIAFQTGLSDRDFNKNMLTRN